MGQKTRTCCVCGKEYKYCNKCSEDKNKPLWYFSFCSSNCKEIYDVTSKFENKQIEASGAKRRLDKLDLTNYKNFGNSYKSSIEKIKKLTQVVIKKTEVIEKKDAEEVLEKEPTKKVKKDVE